MKRAAPEQAAQVSSHLLVVVFRNGRPMFYSLLVYTAAADGAAAGVVWLGELPFEAVSDKVLLWS